MFVMVLKRPKLADLIVVFLLALLIFGMQAYLWSWLKEPYPPPSIGLEGQSTELVQWLFSGRDIGEIQLGTKEELLIRLEHGELDYLIEVDAPTTGLVSWYLTDLEPVLVVPFFAGTTAMELAELQSLLEKEPENVLVSGSLALPGYPWSSFPVPYLSSTEVVRWIQEGRGKIGILPVQDRHPSVRVISLLSSELACRPLYLSRVPKSWPQKIKDRYTGHQDLRSTNLGHQSQAITMLAVGDIMLDRDVKKEGLREGWEQIFASVAPRLGQADLAFANLESPIGDKGHFINMFQAPPEAIKGLSFAGIDVVSLANNHALDYHHEGMLETMRILDEHQIAWVGAGRNINEARQPLIKEANGVRLGFLAYTEMWFVHAREPISWEATEEEPGVVPARLDIMVEDIKAVKNDVDCVIVSVHWGKEYTHEPTSEQKRLARAAIDAGADLVLGHHPHVLQGIEFYKEGVIAYSLGNFVFDLNLPKTWDTMILEFTVGPSGPLDMKVIPAHIFGVEPRILDGTHKNAVYSLIRDLSLQMD